MDSIAHDARLTPSEIAFQSVERREPRYRARAAERLSRIARLLPPVPLHDARLTINFHPDRPTPDGRTVIQALLAEGIYRNQFEVGMTNGDPTAFPGGRRHQQESDLFDGAYDDADPDLRPRYGAVDLLGAPLGGWPRFGSCFLVLRSHVLERSTFLIGGSFSVKSWVGRRAALEELLGSLGSGAGHAQPRRGWRSDGWIELQVHGTVCLSDDVVALVLDDSFRGTAIERAAEAISRRYGPELRWTPPIASDMRLWRMPESRRLARGITESGLFRDGFCTAGEIGRVLYSGGMDAALLSPMTSELRDNIAKFLWNRMLLADDVMPAWAASFGERTD